MKTMSHSKQLKRPKLSRERIAEKALQIAKSKGITALSMRTVAAELHVEAMSLYKHVENKDDLLDLIIELIIKKIKLPSDNLPWKLALMERAQSEKKVLSEHAWIVPLLEARSGTGSIRLQHQNHMLGILKHSGFSIELAFNTMISLTGYIYGFVVFATAWSSQSKEKSKTIQKVKNKIDFSSFPHVLEAINFSQSLNKKNKSIADISFEFGIKHLLDGIEKEFNECYDFVKISSIVANKKD